jgi:methylated-DNA-protein-cysteine methyltransferase-like protein
MQKTRYQQIYAIVRQIPPGKVASYGQIARLVEGATARMVGYAMHANGPEDGQVPWQRVVNSQGRISAHGDGIGASLQRQMLEEEGVVFDRTGRIDLEIFGWLGRDFIASQTIRPPKKSSLG